MAEYIEREAALSQTEILTIQTQEYGKIDVMPVEYIANLPTINSEDAAPVVHGRWIKDESGVICCSECGEEHEWEDYRAPYCDTCGAKMEGGAIDAIRNI